ncbi:MAG: B12-binding domain-containing radical SAM protein [Bacteroidia bacterium]
MKSSILLITPPFTQLNTPYPATAYLKGFLNTQNVLSYQVDAGIEVILRLFSKKGLSNVFAEVGQKKEEISENIGRIYALQTHYIATIEPVIRFLQGKNPTLAHAICGRTYLPEAARFQSLEDLDWAFGTMGLQDKAKHLATLYLEDLGDMISEVIDPHFGFSRYAERLGRTATHFAPIDAALLAQNTFISNLLEEIIAEKIVTYQPQIVCLSVPFPGNLFGALKIGQYLKEHYPNVKIILGGGYANTELRSLTEPKVFDYLDYICLDDGEAPLLFLLEHFANKRQQSELKRTYLRENGKVIYRNGAKEKDIAQRAVGTPDYSDLPLFDYLSVIEIVNPMHSLWSDGRWNKLTLAHGCYWGKCAFCDISLDYIKNYEPITATILCDRMEEIMAQTGQNGFHFVDEAAPPALMATLAMEILRRKLTVVWWTNIRFEKNFTADLCKLLKASGCIAVSGGLEVASDRLLVLMKKGVTVTQVAKVADNFTQAGIMVHAYLMYGFPTQTAQETIDSLEMVRQLFQNEVLQSGFWHCFAMTAHSPVGLNPSAYQVILTGPESGGFAENDLFHEDPTGTAHHLFAEGLRVSLFNYMHGVGFDFPLQKWFDVKVPKTTISKKYIENAINNETEETTRSNALVIWLGNLPTATEIEEDIIELSFPNLKENWSIELESFAAEWLVDLLPQLQLGAHEPLRFQQVKEHYEKLDMGDFEDLIEAGIWEELRENGLLVV